MQSWLLVSLLAVGHMMAFVDRFALAAVAGPVKAAFHLSETGLGALQGLAFALPYVVAILPLGPLADRIKPQRLIMAAIAVWTLGGLACAFAEAAWQLWAARAVMAAGQAGFITGGLTLLNRTFGGADLARPMSVFTAGSTLGKSVALLASGAILASGLGLPVVHSLVGAAPWRDVFALTALPNLLLIPAFALIRTPDEPAAPKATAPTTGKPVFSLAFITFAVVAIAPVVLIQATAAWTPVLFARSHHLTTAAAALKLGGLILITAPLGHLIGGQVTTIALRRGVSPGLVIAASLALSLPLGLAFCLSPDLDLALASYGLATILLGVAAPAGLTGVSLLAPAERRATANAVFMAAVTLVGVGLGPTLVGAAGDMLFGGAPGLRYALLLTYVVFALLGIGVTFAARRSWSIPAAKRFPLEREDTAAA